MGTVVLIGKNFRPVQFEAALLTQAQRQLVLSTGGHNLPGVAHGLG